MTKQKEFETDDELYNESLTRRTCKEAFDLLEKVIKELNINEFVTVFDVVCVICEFPKPKNLQHASTHGWTRENVEHFSIKRQNNGYYSVFLGSPHALLNDV